MKPDPLNVFDFTNALREIIGLDPLPSNQFREPGARCFVPLVYDLPGGGWVDGTRMRSKGAR